jgi:hypothetical protein
MSPEILLMFALAATTADTVADGRNTPNERLESMKAAMETYAITLDGDRPPAVRLRPDPVFRVGKQKGNFLDGAIFLWEDDTGRPVAAMEAFMLSEPDAPDGKWIHEFTSLATAPLATTERGAPRWSPANAGVTFQRVPGAPKPAPTPAARLRQMRAIAADFKADDDFGGSGWRALRMLTMPIARYGKPEVTPEDGALFAFVEGTDPEVFLFVEQRKGPEGPEWQYALAPMGCWAVKVKFQATGLWELPRRSTGDPSKPLYNFQYWPRSGGTR